MIAIRKVTGKYGRGLHNPLFEVVDFNTKIPTGEQVIGFANARATADALARRAGNKLWVHIRQAGADKVYGTN